MLKSIQLFSLSLLLLVFASMLPYDTAQAANGTVTAWRTDDTVHLIWSGQPSTYWEVCYKKKGSIKPKCSDAIKFTVPASGSNQTTGSADIPNLEIGKNYKFVVFDDYGRKVGKTTCRVASSIRFGC